MNKKVCIIALLVMFVLSLSACQKEPEPEATLAPGITHEEGGVVSTDPPMVEGRVAEIKDDRIILMVQGVEWELFLNDQTKWEMERFAELDMPFLKGSMMLIHYEEKDGVREATKLEHLNAN